jgi:cysteine synthase
LKHKSILDTIGNTPLVAVPNLSPAPGVRLWVKLEGQNPTGSVKDRIALALVEDGVRSGALTREKTILEPTSGNTGISIAMVAKIRGYKFTAVMPDNASPERVALLRAFGAEIIFSEGAKGTNVRAHHEGTGREILEDLPEVRAFVAGLGTGGTLTGVGRRLKEHDSSIKVFAAEPELGELVYGLRSLDEGYVPPIFDPDILDGKIKVRARESIVWTKQLLAREGIFAGISAGAVIWVAQRVAERMDASGGGDVVCLLADGGWKYLSTEAYTQELDVAEAKVEEVLWW